MRARRAAPRDLPTRPLSSTFPFMTAWPLEHEPLVRLAAFAGVFAAIALWEAWAPRRVRTVGRWRRWPGNLGVVALNALVVRALFPAATVGWAVFAETRGWGLLNVLDAPAWISLPVAIVVLDLAVYAQHVAMHRVPVLWRLHRMHHADLEFDVTTGLRFHPGEVVLSMAFKAALVVLLGAPPLAALIFEVVLNATSMFSHGNCGLPARAEAVVRSLLVTPDMHRVHHSTRVEETNSNYGFNLSGWDRLFGTYRREPKAGQDGLVIGLEAFRSADDLRLDRMLVQPFVDPPAPAAAGDAGPAPR
jgi:sterol desaturase/sphingolipid hydroxylase (fatty acid hydroxylase superfamily)